MSFECGSPERPGASLKHAVVFRPDLAFLLFFLSPLIRQTRHRLTCLPSSRVILLRLAVLALDEFDARAQEVPTGREIPSGRSLL